MQIIEDGLCSLKIIILPPEIVDEAGMSANVTEEVLEEKDLR